MQMLTHREEHAALTSSQFTVFLRLQRGTDGLMSLSFSKMVSLGEDFAPIMGFARAAALASAEGQGLNLTPSEDLQKSPKRPRMVESSGDKLRGGSNRRGGGGSGGGGSRGSGRRGGGGGGGRGGNPGGGAGSAPGQGGSKSASHRRAQHPQTNRAAGADFVRQPPSPALLTYQHS